MWTIKFRALNKENAIIELIKKYNLMLYYYPINYYEKRNRYYFIAMGIIKGKERNMRIFLSEIKKLKKAKGGRKVELIDSEKDFFFLISSHTKSEEAKKFISVFYNPAVIHLKPIIIFKDGWEEWEIASLEKKDLDQIIKVGKRLYDLEILKIGQKEVKNFGFLTILPELTEKQRKALEFAYNQGYYLYPRKTSLDRLSKEAKLSFSTFQAHIRKAENKILSFVISSFKR